MTKIVTTLGSLVLLVILATGCSRSGLVDARLDTGGPMEAVLIGDGQTGAAGAELPHPLTVKVLDGNGRPVGGQIVNFVVTKGGGQVYAGAALTDAKGIARDWWTLGPEPGLNTLEVRTVDSETGRRLIFGEFRATGM